MILEHIPQCVLQNIVIQLSSACFCLKAIRFESYKRHEDVYVNRISALCVSYYLLATEPGQLHAPFVEHTVLFVGRDAKDYR